MLTGMEYTHDNDLFAKLSVDDHIRKPINGTLPELFMDAWKTFWVVKDHLQTAIKLKKEQFTKILLVILVPSISLVYIKPRLSAKDELEIHYDLFRLT